MILAYQLVFFYDTFERPLGEAEAGTVSTFVYDHPQDTVLVQLDLQGDV
jgi:hypothetical protein